MLILDVENGIFREVKASKNDKNEKSMSNPAYGIGKYTSEIIKPSFPMYISLI